MAIDVDRLAEYAERTQIPAAQILTGILKPGSYSGVRYALDTYRKSLWHPNWDDLTIDLNRQIIADQSLNQFIEPLNQENARVAKETGDRLAAADPYREEIALLSRMIYLELIHKKPGELPPAPIEISNRAFARTERSYGTAATTKGLSQPSGLFIPPGENEFLQTAESARRAYPKELVRAELMTDTQPLADEQESNSRLYAYTEKLHEIGVNITRKTLADYESLAGGFLISFARAEGEKLDDKYNDLRIPYHPNIEDAKLTLEDGTFDLDDVELPDGKKGRAVIKSSKSPHLSGLISIHQFQELVIQNQSSQTAFSPDALSKYDELGFRFALTCMIGNVNSFVSNYYLKEDYWKELVGDVIESLQSLSADPGKFFIQDNPITFVGALRGDPIAAAVRYQILNNPGFIEQADLAPADAPSLIPAINSFKQEVRYSREGSEGVAFGGNNEEVRNTSEDEIKEKRGETLFVITGPAKEVGKIEALEYPTSGYDYGNFEPVEPSGKTEGVINVRVTDLVEEPRGSYFSFLPTPLNSSLADLEITNYPDNQNGRPFIPERGLHYRIEQSGQGFLSIDGLWGPSSINYSVSIEDRPQKELPDDLKKLDPEIIKDISRRLKRLGYSALAKSINTFLKTNKHIGLHDLAACIQASADYSFNEKSAELRHLDGFANLVNPDTGRLEYQCDGAQALTAYIMRFYFADAKISDKYKIIPTALFPVDKSKMSIDDSYNATLVVSKVSHARVHITDGESTLAILDTTPAIPKPKTKDFDPLAAVPDKKNLTNPDLTDLKSSLDNFSRDAQIRRIFAGISDMQMRYFADTPILQIPRLAWEIIAMHNNSHDDIKEKLVDLEIRFENVSGNFMRFMDPEIIDPRAKMLRDGRVRDALFKVLQEARKHV